MIRFVKLCLLFSLFLTLSGCSWLGWFGKSEEQVILETGSSAPVEIPEGLDKPSFIDQMPIPGVVDYRGLSGQAIELRRPEPLSTSFGVEQIVIRRLGEQRWVFLDLQTATIWPQVVLFWEENHLPVANLNPRTGTLETEWIVGAQGNPDEIYESLKNGSAWSDRASAQQYKFFVRVEPGVRSGSSELHIEEMNRPLAGSDATAVADWDGESDNSELEGKMLSSLAYYLGDRIAQGPTVSLLAAGLQESKATLVAESDGMVLKFRLGFDRAWATVGQALENANVSIEDLDRSSAVYYVYYTSRHQVEPGFFGRLFGGGKDGDDDENPGHRFKVELQTEGEEIWVTVGSNDSVGSKAAVGSTDNVAIADTQSLILQERLLKLIKEYST
jgi:outer membrane protein assembly factor BamC